MRLNPKPDLEGRAAVYSTLGETLDRQAHRISMGRLGTFLAGVVLIAAGLGDGGTVATSLGLASALTFVVLVVLHARVLARSQSVAIRERVHRRHLARLGSEWLGFPHTGDDLLPRDHDFAGDIDLVGSGSLFQRIDTTHTVNGARTLAAWLGTPANPEVIRQRQEAVFELRDEIDFRETLEAAASLVDGDAKLDAEPFLRFTQRKAYIAARPAFFALLYILPVFTIAAFVASYFGLPDSLWWIGIGLQAAVVFLTGPAVKEGLDLVAERRGYLEAFQKALVAIEEQSFQAPALVALQQRVFVDSRPPSQYLGRLDRWAGLSELRTQFPLNLLANFTLLWDLQMLFQLERWNTAIGSHLEDSFVALGEVEALASLATLAHLEPGAVCPEISSSGSPLIAEALSHPLLPDAERIANDVSLDGEGSALIVTGSNMAGKSTLLRALGLNVALALAGGSALASRLSIPVLRLRASMRARDSLQQGASYFHAELEKLRTVVGAAGDDPPVLFLLDELLRGTNARARHIGARSVVTHLLSRRGRGLVATHDIALAAMEAESGGKIKNAHFTDVMKDGEMYFDYRLRPGVVRTSNALRLLKMAGIEVEVDDSLDASLVG